MQSLYNAQTIFLHDFAIPLSKVWVEGHSEQKEIKKAGRSAHTQIPERV